MKKLFGVLIALFSVGLIAYGFFQPFREWVNALCSKENPELATRGRGDDKPDSKPGQNISNGDLANTLQGRDNFATDVNNAIGGRGSDGEPTRGRG